MARALADAGMTVAEFVRWHDGTDTRHELVGGAAVAMAPPSGRHAEIGRNVYDALRPQLRPPGRPMFGAGVARALDDDECRVPDVFVTCEATPGATFAEPRLVVAVLSPSTEKEDRSAELDFYESLPGVVAILLVRGDRRRVQLHTREAPRWPAQDFTAAATVPLPAPGLELALDDICAGIDLPGEAA